MLMPPRIVENYSHSDSAVASVAESIAESGVAPCCFEGPPHACKHWQRFDISMVIARCRSNLTLEARGLATRMLAEGPFSAQLLRDQLMLAIASAQPRSRLVPLDMRDEIVEKIIGAVVQDVAATWI